MSQFAYPVAYSDFIPSDIPETPRRRPPVLLLSLAAAVAISALSATGVLYHLRNLPVIDPAPGSAEAYVADGPLGGPRLVTLTPPDYTANMSSIAPAAPAPVQLASAAPQTDAVTLSAQLPADTAAQVTQAVSSDRQQPVTAEAAADNATMVADEPQSDGAAYAGQDAAPVYAGVSPDPEEQSQQ